MTITRRSKYQLERETHQAIFTKDIAPELFTKVKPSEKPQALIYGGQPGAGKSSAINAAMSEFGQEAIVAIIGDELRSYHPRYKELLSLNDGTAAFYTDADTAGWVEMAIAHATEKRFGMVIEGTMRNADKVADTMTALRAAGYAIDARVLVVKHAVSWQGVLERYEGQKADKQFGRMTTPEAHQAAYDGMIGTVDRIESEKLADSITLMRRAGPFYQKRLIDGKWSTKRTAVAAIATERKRAETPAEIQELMDGYARIERLLSRPDRRAQAEEFEALDVLRRGARSTMITDSDPEDSKQESRNTPGRKTKDGKDPFE